MIRWFARNDIAANFLLVGVLLAGVITAFYKVPLQVDPDWQFNDIFIRMNYRGATAKDVERDILIPIEEAIKDLPGIAEVHSEGSSGRASLYVEAKDGVNMRELMEELKGRIDGITTFPAEAERPRVYIPDSNAWKEVITVAVTGDLEEEELYRAARRVRDDLIELDGISQAQLQGERPFEIAVEANQESLRSYGLGFQDLTNAIRQFSVDLPAGSIESSSGNLTVRAKGQAFTKEEFENIPLRASDGADVRLGEIAHVKDGFDEEKRLVRFNGEPALMVEVMRHDNESAIVVSERVHEYVDTAATRFPPGIRLYAWDDESISIRGRLTTLTKSMLQGCVLVFLLLGLFLRPMFAFWVVIGIPFSFAGGILFMPVFDITANLMSVFGFIIVLGLVVDDAIVTGENIFSKMKSGMDPLEASITGTKEVAVPVTFGVLTTIVAFIPLLYFEGRWATYARQIPPVVAPVLLFSLIESKLILPSHLKHIKTGRTRFNFFSRFQKRIADGLELCIERFYNPSLAFSIKHRYTVAAVFASMALLMYGYCKGGNMGFVSTPTVDMLRITASVDLPNGTPLERTDIYVRRITDAVETLRAEFMDGDTGQSLIRNVYTETGDRGWSSNTVDETRGDVSIEIMPPSQRSEPGPKNSVIANRWKEIVGDIPEAFSFSVRGERRGERGDRDEEPIELELRGEDSPLKVEIAHDIVDILEGYDGISDAFTRVGDGEDELELSLKPRAAELKITQQALAQQVRQAFYGQEAQRVQRGRDDIRVMVRLTRDERESLHTLDTLKIRTPDGAMVALSTIADVKMVKAPGRVERKDGAEVIEIFAVPEDEEVDIVGIAESAYAQIQKEVNRGENLSFRFTGYIAEHEASKKRTLVGGIALMFALYALLAIPFKSLVQPIFVLLAVPFGIIGALLGHIVMDIVPSYLSVFGMLALAGVVVNDSLVMVDYVNCRRAEGESLKDAILAAGGARFRPIMLTSLTTFAGLMPLIFERSIQAQFLIPMAVSLGFGILFATVITLYLIPGAYMISDDVGRWLKRATGWYLRPFRSTEGEENGSERV
ncbi:MAG: efflux RND transporter permease subunit [Verrucomicrobiae bacterium]|nr:efflux RND transporter permease subunit [Verrucomicrobiae bacterium]